MTKQDGDVKNSDSSQQANSEEVKMQPMVEERKDNNTLAEAEAVYQQMDNEEIPDEPTTFILA